MIFYYSKFYLLKYWEKEITMSDSINLFSNEVLSPELSLIDLFLSELPSAELSFPTTLPTILPSIELDKSIKEIIIELDHGTIPFNNDMFELDLILNNHNAIPTINGGNKCQYENEYCEKLGLYIINAHKYCYKHYTSISSTKCNLYKKCKNKARYRYPGKCRHKIQACEAHRTQDMFPIGSLGCKVPMSLTGQSCNKPASAYALDDPEKLPLYCVRHAKMILRQYGEYEPCVLSQYRSKNKLPNKVAAYRII